MIKPKNSFFHKLLIFFILIGIIPPVSFAFLSYTFSSKILQEAIYEQAYNSLIKINENIDELLNEYKAVIDIMEIDSNIRKVLSGEVSIEENYYDINEKIYFLLAGKKYKFPIYIFNTSGEAVFSTSKLPDVYKEHFKHEWGIFRKLNESNDETILYPQKFVNNHGESIVFTLGKNIIDSRGNPVGYILIDIKRDAILNIINSLGSSKVDDMILLDEFFYIITDVNNPEKEGFFWDSDHKEIIEENKRGNIYLEDNRIPNLLVYYTDDKSKLTTVATVPLNIVQESNSYVKEKILISLIISLILAFIISFFMAKHIVKPIIKLAKSMKKVEEGNLTVQVNLNRNDELGVLEKSFNQMVVQLKESMSNVIDKQQRLRIAEIKILQAQINPHFLYNTLDAIKWMAKLNGVKEISVIATNLGNLLRNSINTEQEFLTVKDNLHLIESYLEIQKIRYTDGFDVQILIDNDIMEYKIPKLILQPLVENAIVHGFENIEGKGLLIIKGFKEIDTLFFEVIDNGIGMNKEEIDKAKLKKGDEHIGIYNVDQRLILYYGEDYGIIIESKLNVGTKIILKIPDSYEGNS